MTENLQRPQNFDFGRLKEKGTIQETSKAVDTDWFAANITPTNAPANHRIYIRMATTSIVNLQMDDGTNSNIVMNLNDGVALDANDLYAFDVIIPDGYSYNIQHKTGTQDVNGWIVESGVLS